MCDRADCRELQIRQVQWKKDTKKEEKEGIMEERMRGEVLKKTKEAYVMADECMEDGNCL